LRRWSAKDTRCNATGGAGSSRTAADGCTAPGGARASETDGRGRRRRACFSVSCPGLLDPGREPLDSLETLAEVGFSIDSSIFPMRTPRYGIADWELAPHRIRLPNELHSRGAGGCLAGAAMADPCRGWRLLPGPTAGLADARAPRDHGRTSPAGHLLPSVRVQPSGARRLSPECSDAAPSFARARSRFVRSACPDTPAVGALRAFR
jgi:hypothetical protein